MAKDSVIGKVKRLLNMTVERGCTQPEAERAMEMVQKILFRHKLSMAEVKATDSEEKEVNHITKEGHELHPKKHEGKWKPSLAHAVARYNFCKTVQSSRGDYVYFIGTQTDVEVVKELYNWIVEQLEGFCDDAAREYQGPDRIPTFRRAFYQSAVYTISSRLYHQWDDLRKQTEASTALVLVTEGAIKEYMDVQFPNLRTARTSDTSSFDGHRAGGEAGKLVNLTRPTKRLKGD